MGNDGGADMFNDWNYNGKQEAFDSFVNYNLANGKKARGNG